jgi:predicted DsbA family dithiol-disulfide isomerase
MNDRSPVTVELFVDPSCPWAWLTSRWLAEVERVRAVRVVTRGFSLAEVNRGKEKNEAMREGHSAGEQAGRLIVQARREGGDPAAAAMYEALGDAYHEAGRPLNEPDTLTGAAVAAGFAPELSRRALDDPSTYDDLLADHRRAVELGGFGVPTLSIDGSPGFFGPVIDTRLTGDAAGELWDHVVFLLRHPNVFELKRERTRRADVGRSRLQAQAGAGGSQVASGASG